MFVDLVPGNLLFTGESNLDVYTIMETNLTKTIDTEKKLSGNTITETTETVIVVKITLGRGLFTIFLTIYLTTILTNLVGHSSVFYSDVYFEAQVSLNVTVMLVQVTMFTSVSILRGVSILVSLSSSLITSALAAAGIFAIPKTVKQRTPKIYQL